MAKKQKTWAQKLEDAKRKPGLPKMWFCQELGKTLVIAPPEEIEKIIRTVRKGRVITLQQIGQRIAAKYDAEMACPITTGIFAWLIAHAADEAERANCKKITPWWRVLKTGGELNGKYPGGTELQRERLNAEGHTLVIRGKKVVVAD